MDSSLSNFELPSGNNKTESDSNSDKSDNLYDIIDSDSSTSSVFKLDEDFDNNLPETVTLLKHPNGAKVYLVGTAHFSKESQEDVTKVIRNVRPHIVVLELCNARTNILSLDEETVLREAKNIDMDKILSTIKANGVYNGIMYILLLNMSAHLTKEIGMAPGGEFRVAYKEAAKIPNCGVHLGDRPIHITLKRALAKLSWFQTIKLAWHLLTCKDPVSVEEIEKCKKRDMLEQLLADLAGEYPAFGEVFLDERDIFLTHSLQAAAVSMLRSGAHVEPPSEPLRIVGVVGIGHAVGITKLWPVNQHPFLKDILTIPPQSLSSKVIKVSFKISLLTFGGFLIYRYVPVPKVLKESCEKIAQKALTSFREIHVSSVQM